MQDLAVYGAWGMSLFGAVAWWCYGNKYSYAPLVGLAHQFVVLVFTLASGAYGLLPGILMFTAIHIRNYIYWKRGGQSERLH